MKQELEAILKGLPVSPGTARGVVKIVKSPADVNKVTTDDIMVVSTSSPAFAIGVMNAAGLICEGGGILTHICIVAKEIGIPCIARAEKATETLKENSTVTLDADQGMVYGE